MTDRQNTITQNKWYSYNSISQLSNGRKSNSEPALTTSTRLGLSANTFNAKNLSFVPAGKKQSKTSRQKSSASRSRECWDNGQRAWWRGGPIQGFCSGLGGGQGQWWQRQQRHIDVCQPLRFQPRSLKWVKMLNSHVCFIHCTKSRKSLLLHSANFPRNGLNVTQLQHK